MPLPIWTAFFLFLGAMAAGVTLWRLHVLQQRAVHVMATRDVMSQGEALTTFLATLPEFNATNMTSAQWHLVNTLVSALNAAQNELQYVSIERNGETIFHRQTTDLALTEADGKECKSEAPKLNEKVKISSVNLEIAGKALPVMVFRQDSIDGDGNPLNVEIGIQRTVVSEAEKNALHSIHALLRLSLFTVLAVFSICLLLLIRAMQRDRQREKKSRQEEHLTFSGAIANGIVHDFRNPMSSVRLDAQMLEKEAQKADDARLDRVVELSQRITHTINRMDRIFNEFLFLARPSAETLEKIDLSAAIRECLETLMPRIEQADLRIVNQWQAPIPSIMATPSALKRALVNILLNAIQFSPKKGEISIKIVVDDGNVILEIGDHGPGIPARNRQKIFEMFFSTRPEGTGLGLFMAKTAIEKCGGQISAHECPGGGTNMRIVLRQAKS